MKICNVLTSATILVMPLVSACAAPENQPVAVAQTRIEFGNVEGVDVYRVRESQDDHAAAVIGGILGGVLGHQVGQGRGNTVATIGGALAGAAVGNEIEKERSQPVTHYRVRVKLDSGTLLSIDESADPNLRGGDRVRVVDGRIYRE